MTTHVLKIGKRFFEGVSSGVKTFEIRYNDRDFQAGDIVVLEEVDDSVKLPSNLAKYTGESLKFKIGYVTSYEQQHGYVVFSLLPL